MANKTALITGVTGQDGAHLARLLLQKRYTVHGIKRRSSSFNTARVDQLYVDPHEGHWATSLLKRWLLGTHAGAVGPKHLQAHLDEFAFRHNRRKTNGVGRIAARVIEQLVAREPLPMRKIIDESTRCRSFTSAQHAVPT